MVTKNKYFTASLLLWNKNINNRPMPWKGEKDPYKIWLSEIILQQTRVEQGWDYYNRFVAAFPTIEKLANAPETKVFKLWEGLGYYSRCKNLITTAQFIAKECNGKFPDNYDEILNLRGVGPYTAAAIASFAYNLPYAVVDGNVFRVLSRFFEKSIAIDSTEGKKTFTTLANELLNKKQAGIYNQALMDFGAVVCKPKLPLCEECFLQTKCAAYLKGLVNVLPLKEKKIKQKVRYFFYFITEHKGKVYIRKRGKKDIWENLYEFVLFETAEVIEIEQLINLPAFITVFKKNTFTVQRISKLYSQKLTHQTIHGQFIKIKLNKITGLAKGVLDGYQAVDEKELAVLPFPKFITSYLKDKNVSLNLL
jgi:A/G-specific adenine glycosylase